MFLYHADIMRHLIFSTRGQDEESDSDDSDSIADTFPGLFPAHIPPVESNPSPPAEDQNETTSTIKVQHTKFNLFNNLLFYFVLVLVV